MDLGMVMEDKKKENIQKEEEFSVNVTKKIIFECPGLHTYYELLE